MDNNNQPKRPPELLQPEDITSGGENMNDDNLEEPNIHTTYDLRQAADDAMALFEKKNKMVSNDEDQAMFDESMCLIFEIVGSARILTLDIDQDVVVGRSDKTDNFSAGLDLTEFGAYQLGLSRRHAIIRRNESELELEDSGSRNGTFLNEEKIKPHIPHTIHNGDLVRFGNMRVQLRFARKAL